MTVRAAQAAAVGLLDVDDAELGARILGSWPTNEGRDPALLQLWSSRAQGYGAGLARGVDPRMLDRVQVREREGGLEGRLVLATYDSHEDVVTLFTDAMDMCEQAVERLGWRSLFPVGSVRAAAIAHELGHRQIAGDRGLKKALGHELFRIGPWRPLGFIAGTDELAAHAFSQQLLGLPRTPLLITAAAASLHSTKEV